MDCSTPGLPVHYQLPIKAMILHNTLNWDSFLLYLNLPRHNFTPGYKCVFLRHLLKCLFFFLKTNQNTQNWWFTFFMKFFEPNSIPLWWSLILYSLNICIWQYYHKIMYILFYLIIYHMPSTILNNYECISHREICLSPSSLKGIYRSYTASKLIPILAVWL